MRFYIEINLISNNEIPTYFLWEKLYQQIHLGLVESMDSSGKVPIGASFPEYSIDPKGLGSILRLFAQDKEPLLNFDIKKRLQRISDYVRISEIQEVPLTITNYSCFFRRQSKSGIERLARRRAKRGNITFEQAMEELKGFQGNRLNVPYIYIRSLSSGEKFSLFIEKIESSGQTSGGFNSYGLSRETVVPIF